MSQSVSIAEERVLTPSRKMMYADTMISFYYKPATTII